MPVSCLPCFLVRELTVAVMAHLATCIPIVVGLCTIQLLWNPYRPTLLPSWLMLQNRHAAARHCQSLRNKPKRASQPIKHGERRTCLILKHERAACLVHHFFRSTVFLQPASRSEMSGWSGQAIFRRRQCLKGLCACLAPPMYSLRSSLSTVISIPGLDCPACDFSDRVSIPLPVWWP
jgi:hypothetical protein